MNIPGARSCVAICLLAAIAGCATPPTQSTPVVADRPSDSEETKNRELSYGYGQLYKTASGLKHLRKLLLLKVESAKVSMLIDDISEYAEKLSGQLEKMDRDYPSLRIDDPGLPELETKRRKAVVWDEIYIMAPIVGKTGKDFERTLLLSQVGVLNNVRFLAEVIKDAEKSEARKALVQEAQSRLNSLYQRTIRLLEQDYFC